MTPDDEASGSVAAQAIGRAVAPRGDDVAAALATDVGRGLSAAEAAARLARFGPNRLEAAQPVPAWRKFLGQFADPLIYLLLAAVVVSLVAWVLEGGEAAPYDAIVIAAIVVANAVLGYVQEARAEQAVAALQRMAAATAGVRARRTRGARFRRPRSCRATCCVLAEGDAVAADARLVEAASLTVAEASLTGESEAVLKDIGAIARAGRARRPREHGLQRHGGRPRTRPRRRDRDRDGDRDGQRRSPARPDRGAGDAAAARGRSDRAHARDRRDRDRRRRRRRDPAHRRHPDGVRPRLGAARRRLARRRRGARGAAGRAVGGAGARRAADGAASARS